jgi:23S rRNA G2445 N2-methylase RlmL
LTAGLLVPHVAANSTHFSQLYDRIVNLIAKMLAIKLRLKESRKTPFFNGALECRLFRFDMVAGGNRKGGDEAAQ